MIIYSNFKLRRKKSLIVFLFITILLFFSPVYSQKIENADKVYDGNIVTVLCYSENDQLSDPVIRLKSNDWITLSFDDLSNKTYPFKYTITHCTSDWQTSDLEQMDYIDGYFEDDLNNYKFSFNAKLPYIHYTLQIPNENMRPKLSGNYILKVYLDEPTEGNVFITRRFYVVDPLTTIKADIPYYPKNLSYTKLKQQIDFSVVTPNNFDSDPARRFKVTIRQNGRWDNVIQNIKPTSVSQYLLEFNYPNGIVFDGGNAPRFFDMKSYWYQSQYIRRIIPTSDGYKVILHTDASRAHKEFETYGNIHGQKLIKARNSQNANLEGEYADVKFTLKQNKIKDANIYILGAINDWHLNDLSKMIYNNRLRQYEVTMFLKQGYYEYYYVVLKNGATKGDITFIEGDHWETKNQYTIAVYYHERTPEYDRLVGWLQFIAHQNGK